eukprot:465245-Rhodomonas_salina.2
MSGDEFGGWLVSTKVKRWVGDLPDLHWGAFENIEHLQRRDEDGGEGKPHDRAVDASAQHVGPEVEKGQKDQMPIEDGGADDEEDQRYSHRCDEVGEKREKRPANLHATAKATGSTFWRGTGERGETVGVGLDQAAEEGVAPC